MSQSDNCPFCGAVADDKRPVCRQCGFEFGTQWQPPAGEEEARFEPGLRTCPHCGARNPVGRDFCSTCNAPVGDYTSVKPFERIWSTGFIYRRSSEGLPGLPGPARVGRACLGILLLSNPVLVVGFLLLEGKNGFFRFLYDGGTPGMELGFVALLLLPMAAMGYLGLRLLGVRFGRPKERPGAPRPLREPGTRQEPTQSQESDEALDEIEREQQEKN